MTNDQNTHARSVVELEFGLDESEFFLTTVSKETECTLELETVIPRSDGTVLEFLTMRGIDPSKALECFKEAPGIREVRLLQEDGDEALFELISESRIAMALADEQTLFKGITVSGGKGRLTADVPPHIDVSAVIESFLSEYPGAELIARRETNRRAPLISEVQFVTELLEDLTEKQLRALRVAHANGYFEFPRQRKAEDIAELLEVSTPTFSQHLRVAEQKLLNKIF